MELKTLLTADDDDEVALTTLTMKIALNHLRHGDVDDYWIGSYCWAAPFILSPRVKVRRTFSNHDCRVQMKLESCILAD